MQATVEASAALPLPGAAPAWWHHSQRYWVSRRLCRSRSCSAVI